MKKEKKLKGHDGNEFVEGEPFRYLCTFCLWQGQDPSENAKIGKNQDSQFKAKLYTARTADNAIQQM